MTDKISQRPVPPLDPPERFAGVAGGVADAAEDLHGAGQARRAGGDAEAAGVKRGHGDPEALARSADDPVGRYAGVIEADLGDG
jgi:hypothetical protein